MSQLSLAILLLALFALALSIFLYRLLLDLNPALLPYEEDTDLDDYPGEEIHPIYPPLYSATITSWGMHKGHFAKGELMKRGCPWCYEKRLYLL